MATKAELEAELAELKKMFAENRNNATAEPDEPGTPDQPEPDTADTNVLSAAMEAIKGSDLEDMAKQIIKELEGLPERKPLMTAFGAFVLGYLIGRAR